jgi:hypothetical protein
LSGVASGTVLVARSMRIRDDRDHPARRSCDASSAGRTCITLVLHAAPETQETRAGAPPPMRFAPAATVVR